MDVWIRMNNIICFLGESQISRSRIEHSLSDAFQLMTAVTWTWILSIFSFVRLKPFSNRSTSSCFCFSSAIGPPAIWNIWPAGWLRWTQISCCWSRVYPAATPTFDYYIFTIYKLYINYNVSYISLYIYYIITIINQQYS